MIGCRALHISGTAGIPQTDHAAAARDINISTLLPPGQRFSPMLQRGFYSQAHTVSNHKAATTTRRHGKTVHHRRRTTTKTQTVPQRRRLREFEQLPWQRIDMEHDNATEDPLSSADGAPVPRVRQSVGSTPSNETSSNSSQADTHSASEPAASVYRAQAHDAAVAALASAEAEANMELTASKQEAKQKRLQQKARRERALETQELTELAGLPAQVAQQRLDARDARSQSYWTEHVQMDMSTGFPAPLGYAPGDNSTRPRRSLASPLQPQPQQTRQSAACSGRRRQLHDPTVGASRWPSSLRPAFRSHPSLVPGRGITDTQARILFIEEGNLCRSVLAESIFTAMLVASGTKLNVVVDSASVGPTVAGPHDSRVVQAAQQAGLHLEPRQARVFDEVNDIVNYDLVLVMDCFDAVEVLREVAVLDAIHRSGSYSTRVRQLASFVKSRRRLTASEAAEWGPEISDPLYPMTQGDSASATCEASTMATTVRHLQMACGGLLNFLCELRSRGSASVGLREALQQSLKCPLLDAMPGSLSPSPPPPPPQPVSDDRTEAVRPYRGRAAAEATLPHTRPRRYWKSLDNVQREVLEWVYLHGETGSMPSMRQLRGTGANSLQFAITAYHGGFKAVAGSLGWQSQSQRAVVEVCWEELARLLQPLMAPSAHPPSTLHSREGSPSQRAPLTMPTQAEMIAGGGWPLLRAVKAHGGSSAVSARLQIKPCRPGLNTMAAVSKELSAVVSSASLEPGWLPSKAQLVNAGRRDLVNTVVRFGGFRKVARQLDLKWQSGSGTSTSADTTDVTPAATNDSRSHHTLPAATVPSYERTSSAHPLPSHSPSPLPLPSCGPAAAASLEHGGRGRVRQRHALQGSKQVSPALAEAAAEMREFMAHRSLEYLPTRVQLQDAGRIELHQKVVRSGGVRRLARLLRVPHLEAAGRPSKAFVWI